MKTKKDQEFKEVNAIVELDDAKIETPFPEEVKDILVEFSDVFRRSYLQVYHRSVQWTTESTYSPGQSHLIEHPTGCLLKLG